MKPFISLIATGGTVSEVRDARDLAAVDPTVGAEQLLEGLPWSAAMPDIRSVNLPFTRSDDITVSDIVGLAAVVTKEIDQGARGVVVTRGTDTLEETAFGLDLLVARDPPVVVTGAMRPHEDLGADGRANLLSALRVAADPAAHGVGTVVVLNDDIHAARFVQKSHTSSLESFQSRTGGSIGWLTEGRVRIASRPTPQRRITVSEQNVPLVAIAKMFVGCDGRVIEAFASLGCEGLVVEGFGGGHVPASVVESLGRLSDALPVVISTRVPRGEGLQSTYGSSGDEVDLRARGLLPAGILSSAKSHLLLCLLLMSGNSDDVLKETFEDIASGCPGQTARSRFEDPDRAVDPPTR
jgi:L-asparaginase